METPRIDHALGWIKAWGLTSVYRAIATLYRCPAEGDTTFWLKIPSTHPRQSLAVKKALDHVSPHLRESRYVQGDLQMTSPRRDKAFFFWGVYPP